VPHNTPNFETVSRAVRGARADVRRRLGSGWDHGDHVCVVHLGAGGDRGAGRRFVAAATLPIFLIPPGRKQEWTKPSTAASRTASSPASCRPPGATAKAGAGSRRSHYWRRNKDVLDQSKGTIMNLISRGLASLSLMLKQPLASFCEIETCHGDALITKQGDYLSFVRLMECCGCQPAPTSKGSPRRCAPILPAPWKNEACDRWLLCVRP